MIDSSNNNMVIGTTVAVAAAVVFSFVADDWLPGAAIFTLWAIWWLLPDGEGPPILAMAMSYQWTQVTVGMFYSLVTGRDIPWTLLVDYRPTMMMSLVCLLALSIGLYAGRYLVWRNWPPAETRPELALTWTVIVVAYVLGVLTEGVARRFAFQTPSLTQPILALASIRLMLLFIVLRRLASPTFRWPAILGLIGVETVLNSTGYFVQFREPLILAILAVLEVFDRRKTEHVVVVAIFAFTLASLSLVWMSVRTTYRQEIDKRESFDSSQRFDKMVDLVSEWWTFGGDRRLGDVDFLIDRMWAIYFPALAVQRVPSVVPHTDGHMFEAAIKHVVQPRVFFPEKPELPSDSELVRRYSGVWVAGREQNTSIAFGYMAESYVDFGVPWMFLPFLVFGTLVGLIYGWFQRSIRHAELRVPMVTVTFWLALYLFERSWAIQIGNALTLLVYAGGLAWLVDRFLLVRFEIDQAPEYAPAFDGFPPDDSAAA